GDAQVFGVRLRSASREGRPHVNSIPQEIVRLLAVNPGVEKAGIGTGEPLEHGFEVRPLLDRLAYVDVGSLGARKLRITQCLLKRPSKSAVRCARIYSVAEVCEDPEDHLLEIINPIARDARTEPKAVSLLRDA